MKSEDRKAAVAAYKERKSAVGIYAVRCLASGACWVGRCLDLTKVQNRHWFVLRLGNSPHRSLQAAWNGHGAETFVFEELERLAEDEPAYVRDAILAERLAAWSEQLGAERI